jgi:hypothetical protein
MIALKQQQQTAHAMEVDVWILEDFKMDINVLFMAQSYAFVRWYSSFSDKMSKNIFVM